MKNTQYGAMVDTGIPKGDGGTHGLLELKGAVNLEHMSTMPTEFHLKKTAQLLDARSKSEVLTLQMGGSVFGAEETLTVCWVIPWMDAGRLAAHLFDAAKRSPDPHSELDFSIGLKEEMDASSQRSENNGEG